MTTTVRWFLIIVMVVIFLLNVHACVGWDAEVQHVKQTRESYLQEQRDAEHTCQWGEVNPPAEGIRCWVCDSQNGSYDYPIVCVAQQTEPSLYLPVMQ